MTPEEALALLDQVVAQVKASRADHARLQEAVEVLRRYVNVKAPRLTHLSQEDRDVRGGPQGA